MRNIIIDKPYRFVPPHPGRFWNRIINWYLPRYLRKTYGIVKTEIRGAERLEASLAARHGIVLAPNHSRPPDPMVMGMLARRVGRPFYTVASWHLFMQGRLQAWALRHGGAFSIYREGLDREALKAATNILVEAKRPLVIFPEGIVTRTNDRLGTLQEGPAFIARSAAKQRAKAGLPSQVVIHPVALKYYFGGEVERSIGLVLDDIETRLSWRPQRQHSLIDRIVKVGEALLSLKEIEYLGTAQPGPISQRLSRFIDHLLVPLEKEWLGGRREPSVVERVKRLRIAVLPDIVNGELSEDERARRWRHLADMYLAEQLSLYPPDYVRSRPTPERLLETVERFEEGLTDAARCHGPMRVVIQVGEPLMAQPGRDRSGGEDPLMKELGERLQDMLDQLSNSQ
jgi:1-acyl-sn-glycerol-3-phosphate acyltransferase